MTASKTSAYTEDTLEIVAAGLALLLAQNYIVTNPFFDEKEIRNFLLMRRQFHGDFVQACVDLAAAFEEGKFGPAVKPAVPALKAIGHLTVKQDQQALRQMSKALRGLKHLQYSDVDNPKLMRLITLARRIDNSSSKDSSDNLKWFLEALVKVSVVPARLKTLLRKVMKLPSPGMTTDTANPGEWFDMPDERKNSLRELTEKTEQERLDIYEKYKDDPEARQKAYVDTARKLQKIQNVAGVNIGIIKKAPTEPLDAVLKREAKVDADGPTEFIKNKLESYIKDAGIYFATRKSPKEGAPVPREIGKVLTNLRKAKTFSTMQRVVKEAVDKKVLGQGAIEDVDHILGQASKNRAVREGTPLAPLNFEPKTVEEFMVEHDTGKVELDPEYTEDEKKDLLGRVSRAISDLEGVYGKGFCGKHSKKLAFRFNKGFHGTSSAHYFTWDNKQEWQPRVTFGPEYEGLLAHELSHYLEDLLSYRIEKQVNPERAAESERKGWGAGSGIIFGNTGVPLSRYGVGGSLEGSRKHIGQTIPEFVDFIDAVLGTPDYKRWEDKLGSSYDTALPGAIKNLTGMSYYDLPKDHPYSGIIDKAQYRSDLPPELNAEVQRYFKEIMGGDDRKLSYYNSATEVWARMCEQYVYNKLIDGGVSNPWLTQMNYEDDVFMDEKNFDTHVRPVMDRLFAKLKDRTLLARVLERYSHQAAEVVADRYIEVNFPVHAGPLNWDDNDSLADALLDDDLSLTPSDLPTLLTERVAARYQEKKKVPKANGKGKTTVYVYSERQVSKRNKDKAERLQKFKPKVEKLRAKYRKDLKAEDQKTRMTALAVALIDETHERVGNEASAKGEKNDSGDPHYGVTGWKKKHITLGSGSATIKYVGKSGVKHEKTVSEASTLSALRDACKNAEGDDGSIFSWEDGSVSADDVNQYLKPFDVSAKDLRGLAANSLCQKALKKIRSKGGKLPADKKEREEKLKSEFKEALDEVSEELGHEPSTLANQYLAPSMRPEYEKDGTVIEKLDD